MDIASTRPKMDIRTRVCIWIILIGMANFLAYTISYSILWGEAIHGQVKVDPASRKVVYFLQSGNQLGRQVSRGEFIYSGIHSISIWPTVMAVVLATLTLAKDRISDSLAEAMVRGRTLVTILAVIIAISMSGLTFLFVQQFFEHMATADRYEQLLDKGELPTEPGSLVEQPTSAAPAVLSQPAKPA